MKTYILLPKIPEKVWELLLEFNRWLELYTGRAV